MNLSKKHSFIILAHQEMKMLKQRRPSNQELDNYFAQCGGTWKRNDHVTHWCGIFVTYLLRNAGANVKWKMGHGIRNQSESENPGGGVDLQYVLGNNGIMPGDICVRGNGQHHFIIIGEPDIHGTFEYCIEGNYGGLGNPLLHQGKRAENNQGDVNYYYRILN